MSRRRNQSAPSSYPSARRIGAWVLSLSAALTCSGRNVAAAERYALDAAGRRAKASVGIPGTGLWPNLTILKGGGIAAIVFNQPSHGRMPGELDCWVTADAGASWQRRTSPVMHEPDTLTNRMNHAVGRSKKGDFIVLSSGWTLIEKEVPIHGSSFDVDQLLDPVVCRSSDNGRTWTVTHGAFPARGPDPESGKLIPHGDIVPGEDGVLRVAAYASVGKKKGWRQAYVLASRDDGKTWGNPVPVDGSTSLNETFILYAGEGRWLALGRGKCLLLYDSIDPGKQWRLVGPVTEVNEIPGHLLRLRDGRLLLSYGRRVKKDEGIMAKVSSDGGRTWSGPVRLAHFLGFDGGYPSSVQLPDGRVLTAYYAKKTRDHDGYHMGQVIWDPDKTFPAGD